MTCSTSLSWKLPAVGFYGCIVAALGLGLLGAASADEGAEVLRSQIVTRLALEPTSRPRWGSFSPLDDDRVLLDIDSQGFVVSLPGGAMRRCRESELPVGWLNGSLLVRDAEDGFRVLDPETLNPRTELVTGTLSMPWTLGRDQELQVLGRVSAASASSAPALIPGADTTGFSLIVRERRSGIRAGGADGSELLGARNELVYRADRKIYRTTVSPDGFKVIVYLGNTDHILFNRLTGRSAPLPKEIEAWSWWPDSTTLLGQTTEITDPRYEEVAETRLFIHQPGGALEPIALPPPLNGAALTVHDLSGGGRILLGVERTVTDPAYLGLFVLEVAWR